MRIWIATMLAALAVLAVLLTHPSPKRAPGDARPTPTPVSVTPAVVESPPPAASARVLARPARAESPALAAPNPAATPAPAPRSADAATADTSGTLVDGRWPARYWSPGHPAFRSPLEHSPGYRKLDDPEAEATVTGRRQVGAIEARLQGGAASATELAMFVLDCLNRDDYHGLRGVQIAFEEFRDILWPEFPQSRPATGVSADEAWGVLLRSSIAGANRAVGEWAGQDLTFDSLSFTQGWTPYTNFNLYLGVRIHARTAARDLVEVKYADGFVERNGQWKVYMYND